MKSETDYAERIETGSRPRANSTTHRLLRRSLVLMTIDLILGCIAFVSAWMGRTFLSLPFTQSLLPNERWFAVDHPWITLVATQLLFPYVFGLFDDIRRIRYREIVSFVFAACCLQFLTVASLFFLTNRLYPQNCHSDLCAGQFCPPLPVASLRETPGGLGHDPGARHR